MLSIRRLILLTMSLAVASSAALFAQTFSGTVSDVRNINTANLLRAMNQGSSDLVLVAAHRGYWRDFPENSSAALSGAFDAGVEIIEIDLRTTSDQRLAVSHDTTLGRQTTGSGDVASTTWGTISGLQLRDRFGKPTSYKMLQFSDVLDILSQYNNGVTGPIVIVDIKDKNPWPAYNAAGLLLQSRFSIQQAVIFKMKMKNIPSIGDVQAAAAAHPSYGHIIPTINPEDGTGNANGFDGPDWDDTTGSGDWTPGSSNFQQLYALSKLSVPFVQQFELNAEAPGDPASVYPSPTGPLRSFATYYQPSFYPEGVTFSSGTCCYLPNPITVDMRGVLSYSLFYNQQSTPGVSLITTDKLDETLSLLVYAGKRNVSEIQ